MKVAIDSYCYHRFFGEVYPGQTPPGKPMTVDTFLLRAKELGCAGVSLESCFLPELNARYLAGLRARLDHLGLERVYAWGHPEGLEAGTVAAAKAEMIQHIEFAAVLGASVMRVVASGPGYRLQPHAPQLAVLARWFREAVQVAEGRGVRLAVENHIDFTAAELKWLIEEVGSAYFGLTLDTANFLRILEDPVAATRLLAPHVFATHIKDARPAKTIAPHEWCYFASVAAGTGLVPIPEIVQVLGDSGYRGMLAVEIDMPHPDDAGAEDRVVAESVSYLQNLLDSQQRTGISTGKIP